MTSNRNRFEKNLGGSLMSSTDTKNGLNHVDKGFLLQKAWHNYLSMLNSLTLEEETLFKWTFWKEPGIILNVHIGRGTDRQADCSARTSLPISVKPEKCSVDVEQANSAQRVCCGAHQGHCASWCSSLCWLSPFFPLVASPCCSRA